MKRRQLAGRLALIVSALAALACQPIEAQQTAPPGQLLPPGPVALTLSDTALPLEAMLVSPGECEVLALCPDELREALRPWIEYRYRQGYRICLQAPAATAWRVRRQIRAVADVTSLRHVVLVGDTPDRFGHNARRAIPTDYVEAKVVSRFGREPEIATDNGFVDFDSDGLPDASIGRIPADSPEQLAEFIRKVINYESAAAGPWQRQINLIAGTGGFGEVTDTVIEKASREIISELIPESYSVSLTWANWASPYCPDPRAFKDVTVERLNEGCLFWVYMGHGHPTRLDYLRTPLGGYPMFSASDVPRLNCVDGAPIALMLACYTGAFDFPHDCLGEQLVMQPGGPVAAVCSSRASMPWGMSSLSMGLIEEYFDGSRDTLGEMMLVARRRLGEELAAAPPLRLEPLDDAEAGAAPRRDHQAWQPHRRFRDAIRLLGETFSPSGNELADEAREHVHLFHLLGDPLLRVSRPQTVELQVAAQEDSQDRLLVRGIAPHAGELVLELDYARDRLRVRPPRRDEFRDDADTLDGYQAVYDQCNSRTVSRTKLQVEQGSFEAELTVPEHARGRCVVKAFMAGAPDRFALGADLIRLERR